MTVVVKRISPHSLVNYFAEVKIKKDQFIFKRELIWNEWFIFIFIDIYNNKNNFEYIVLLFLNFTKIY
jgi:hypothetical protein